MGDFSIWHGIAFSIIAIVTVASIAAAFAANRRLQERLPGVRPYAWGYYLAISTILTGVLIVVASGFGIAFPGPDSSAAQLTASVATGLVGVAYAGSGWLAYRRRRWGWIIMSILSFNPIVWVANVVYGYKRWSEFAASRVLPG